jgi:hypothetical protein
MSIERLTAAAEAAGFAMALNEDVSYGDAAVVDTGERNETSLTAPAAAPSGLIEQWSSQWKSWVAPTQTTA